MGNYATAELPLLEYFTNYLKYIMPSQNIFLLNAYSLHMVHELDTKNLLRNVENPDYYERFI